MAKELLREVAITASRAAGEMIRSNVERIARITVKSSPSDLVTEVDREAERVIRNRILEAFPEHAILGEEGVDPGIDAAKRAVAEMAGREHLWIVDPIDGTTNFIHGFPFFCVSVAFAVKGDLRLGVIYDPLHEELFVAEKGKGATLNGAPINVSSEKTLASSLFGTGFPNPKKGGNRRDGILRMVPRVRNVRTTGSAALHLAYVAAGRLTGFWEVGLNAWDVAAGVLLVTEAGGKISDTLGRPYQLDVRHLLATNGWIHEEALKTLREIGETGFKASENEGRLSDGR